MRNWQGTINWYEDHETAQQIGFNPDGMCLACCRTARDIGPKYASAKLAAEATPQRYRVHNVADLRRGMVLYFDDPNDSNKFGHIVTMIGRVKGANRNSLHDVLVRTNSVVSGRIVVVRGDYFQEHWGDSFQFGAFWLNGVELDYPKPRSAVEKFRSSAPDYDWKILRDAVEAGQRNLRGHVDLLHATMKDLAKAKPEGGRVSKVLEAWDKDRVIRLGLLNEAVDEADRDGVVKDTRNKIRSAIKSLHSF